MQKQESRDNDGELADGILAKLVQQPDPLVRYEALTSAQAVYEALVKQIAAERARAVADMHTSGMSYGAIAEAIGFTRSRAQQLVERAEPPTRSTQRKGSKPMSTPTDLTAFLADHVADWPRPQHYVLRSLPQSTQVAGRTTVEQLGLELFANAEFRALQLGTWLSTPDGQLILAAVEALTPPLYREDVQLLANAVTLAAKMQQDDGRKRAAAAAVVVAAGTALLVAAAKN